MALKAIGVLGATGGVTGLLMYAERYLTSNVDVLAKLAEPSALGVPKLFGAVILGNVVASSLLMFILGAKAASARKKAIDKAKKDGDEHAEERYSYPKLYAEGFSETAKVYNCAQRGHQHALESYPQFLALSAVAGVSYPLVTAALGLLWTYARYKYAEGYSTGDPSKRYSHSAFGMQVWTALVGLLFVAGATGVKLLTA